MTPDQPAVTDTTTTPAPAPVTGTPTDAPSPAPVDSPAPAGTPTAAPVDPTPSPVDLPVNAKAGHSVGDVLAYEDYDYVTETTTVRHALVVRAGENVTINRDGADEDVPALAVVFLGAAVTLPADVFQD